MPVLYDKAVAAARRVKAFVGLKAGTTRGDDVSDSKRREDTAPDENGVRKGPARGAAQKGGAKLQDKRQELRRIRGQVQAGEERGERIEAKKEKKRVQQEIFRLREEARAANRQQGDAPVTGALPDFLVIGAMKGGTTWLYHLLTRHPHVEPAAAKELHYFDIVVEDEDEEWYRGCFPKPRLKDGRMTITGEATPYLSDRRAPQRVARVVPEARLISVLRNPVDRTYSHFQQMVRKGRESRTFEEAVELEKLRPFDEGNEATERAGDPHRGYLSKSIYANQLPHWSAHFGDDQMLVLKSEDLFERTPETLRVVFDFLDLPERMPEEATRTVPERRRNEGKYGQGMDPAVRRELEAFFEPHNKRLYEYLGRDFGW